MTQRKTVFGSETRAVDGCIVTFRLSDGSEHTERFVTLLRSAPTVRIGNRGHNWKTTRFGPTYIEQAVEWADVHEYPERSMLRALERTPRVRIREDVQTTRGTEAS